MSIEDRREKGIEKITELLGEKGVPALDDPLWQHVTDYVYGELWQRPGLSTRDRALITIAMLGAQGQIDQFFIHCHSALNSGVTPDEIRELVLHLGVYAGFPKALDAKPIAEKVIAKELAKKNARGRSTSSHG